MDIKECFKKYDMDYDKDYLIEQNGSIVEIKPDLQHYSLQYLQRTLNGDIELYQIAEDKFFAVAQRDFHDNRQPNPKATDFVTGKLYVGEKGIYGDCMIINTSHLE